jgi:hypothetical protein
MSLTVNDEAMQAVVAKAIVDTLTPEKREALIIEAVKSIITPPRESGGFGREAKPSVLQAAFNSAAADIARREIATRLETDTDFKGRLDALFAETVAKILTGENREKLIDAMVAGFEAALRRERY